MTAMVVRPMSSRLSSIDLADPTLYESGDPESTWAALRAESPVFWNEEPGGAGFWALTRYDDVSRVCRDTAAFSSARGMRLGTDQAAADAAAQKMLIVTDPPRHAKLRRIMQSVFVPSMLRRLDSDIRHTVVDCLERAVSSDGCDFVEIIGRLPVAAVCTLIGVPRADWEFMLERTRIAFGSMDGDEGDKLAKIEAHADILVYYDQLAACRRRQPEGDIVSALVDGEVDGVRLTDEEVFLNCDGLISGGNETTRHAAAGGLLALIENPDQWKRLRADAGIIPTAVVEILRYTSPGMHVLRTATRDVVIRDQPIRAGDRVTLWLAAANRDEDVFTSPERFDVGRSPNRHLTFAFGEHHCLGAALARMELTILLQELTARVSRIEQRGPARRLRSNLLRGLERLPVALHPA